MRPILHGTVVAMRSLLLLAPIALVAAACGQGVAKPFLPGPTAKCLRQHNFTVSTSDANVPLVASTAANGGLRATPKAGGNTLIVAFGADGNDAARVRRSFRRVAPSSLRPHLADVMSSQGNAVLLWTITPAPELEQTALGCLSS
jgi:hypothetical protein